MDVHNKNQLLNQSISKLQVEFILVDHGLCADWSRNTHRRRRDCIYLILDGQGKIVINGNTYYPQKNDLVLLPKNSLVSLYSENDTCYDKYWCDFLMHFNGVSLFDVIDFPYIIHLPDITGAQMLFQRLDTLRVKTDAGSALLLKATLLELVALFLINDTRQSSGAEKKNPFIEKVSRIIEDNLSSGLSVSMLAAQMGFNEKYFISLFDRHFGTTPAKYIKTLRLERVKSDLLYTDEAIIRISENRGFSSIQKLSRDFKASTGMSPSEFRDAFRG